MPLGRISFREVFTRPTRALLTFLSIVIGVAAVVSVFLTTSTTRSAQREMLRSVSGRADLEVVANSTQGFGYSWLRTIRETPGVELAAPSVNRFGVVYAGERSARARILGIDPQVDQQVRDYEIVDGRQLESLDEILLDASFARSLGLSVGDRVRIFTGRMHDATAVGLVEPRGGSGVAVGASAYAVLPAAGRWFGTGSNVDQVQVVASEGGEVGAVREALTAALPEEVTVQEPATRSQMADEIMFSTQNGLHMSIAFALLISLFIIYNTFEMSVGERRKQIGILRAIGTTRGQAMWMVLREAVVMSLVASLLGCVLGIYGAQWLLQATQQVTQTGLPRVQVTPLPLVVAVLFGICVSLLGAYLPARRASQVQPLEAIRALSAAHNSKLQQITTPIAVFGFVFGAGMLAASTAGWMFLGADVVGIVSLLLGVVLIIPASLPWVAGSLMRLLRPLVGPAAMLAERQLTRHLGRSTLTIGVLFIAVATSIGLAGNVLDNVANIERWVARAMEGDFFVRATLPDLATGAAADLPPETVEELSAIPGIAVLSPITLEQVRSGDYSILLIARDFGHPTARMFELDPAEEQRVMAEIQRGALAIGSVLSQRTGVGVGDTLPLATAQGVIEFPVAAIVNDYWGGGLSAYIDIAVGRPLLGLEGSDVVVIKAEPGRVKEVEAALAAYCQNKGLILQSYADVVAVVRGIVNGVIVSLWALLALGCIIAALGLVNTLTMNILEQTREIGMLRVVAMTRGQTRQMIFAQALMMGMLGILPGAIAGVFVSYAISLSAEAILGHNIRFELHPWLVLGAAGLGLLIVLLASLIPAERAARLKLASALQYE
jgi:putative ABC transport system permease protein